MSPFPLTASASTLNSLQVTPANWYTVQSIPLASHSALHAATVVLVVDVVIRLVAIAVEAESAVTHAPS